MKTDDNNKAATAKPSAIVVPAQLAQDVVNYLQTQPYKDVYQMIAALVQCPKQEQADDKSRLDPARR